MIECKLMRPTPISALILDTISRKTANRQLFIVMLYSWGEASSIKRHRSGGTNYRYPR